MARRTTLFCSNLDVDTKAKDLAKEFERYGRLVRCDIPAPKITGHKPFAFIEFEDDRDADDAWRGMHGKVIAGLTLNVQWAKQAPPPGYLEPRGPPSRGRSRSPPPRRPPAPLSPPPRSRYRSPPPSHRSRRSPSPMYDSRRDRDRDYGRERERDRDREYGRSSRRARSPSPYEEHTRRDRDRKDRDRDYDRRDRERNGREAREGREGRDERDTGRRPRKAELPSDGEIIGRDGYKDRRSHSPGR